MLLLLQLASEGIKREYTQSLFDQANYEDEEKDGEDLVRQVKESLGDYFSKKKRAAQVMCSGSAKEYETLEPIYILTNQLELFKFGVNAYRYQFNLSIQPSSDFVYFLLRRSGCQYYYALSQFFGTIFWWHNYRW